MAKSFDTYLQPIIIIIEKEFLIKRKKINMTQKEAASIAGVGVRFLSELENGKPTLEIDKVLNVARIFGIDIEANNR